MGILHGGISVAQKHAPSLLLWFVAAIHHANPQEQLTLPREHKHFARATAIQLGEESDSGGGGGLVDCAAPPRVTNNMATQTPAT